jgi:hypothetical protein
MMCPSEGIGVLSLEGMQVKKKFMKHRALPPHDLPIMLKVI